MSGKSQPIRHRAVWWLTPLWLCPAAHAEDVASLCADRAAIERLCHGHRTGTKRPFGQAMPPALLEKLVRIDLKMEAVLARARGVKITDAMVEAEVLCTNSTTCAPNGAAGTGAHHSPLPATMSRGIPNQRRQP